MKPYFIISHLIFFLNLISYLDQLVDLLTIFVKKGKDPWSSG